MNYYDGVTACNNIAARLPEIKNAAEQKDVASRMVFSSNYKESYKNDFAQFWIFFYLFHPSIHCEIML